MRNHKIRRNRFRSNGRNFGRNGSNHQIRTLSGSLSSNHTRPGFYRGSQNASKLLEKYTSLAKEALSSGDKILSENYLQHADHFGRVISDRNSNQSLSKTPTISNQDNDSSTTIQNSEDKKSE